MADATPPEMDPVDASAEKESNANGEPVVSPVSRVKRVRAAPDVFAPEVKEKEEFVIRQVGCEDCLSAEVIKIKKHWYLQGKGSKISDISNGEIHQLCLFIYVTTMLMQFSFLTYQPISS